MGRGFCLNLCPLLEVMGKVCSVFSAQWTEIAGSCSCLHGDPWRLGASTGRLLWGRFSPCGHTLLFSQPLPDQLKGVLRPQLPAEGLQFSPSHPHLPAQDPTPHSTILDQPKAE